MGRARIECLRTSWRRPGWWGLRGPIRNRSLVVEYRDATHVSVRLIIYYQVGGIYYCLI